MIPARYKDRAHHVAAIYLRRALERATDRRPVIVPEYSMRPRPRWGWREPPLRSIDELLRSLAQQYEGTVARVVELADWCPTVPQEQLPGDPCWRNSFWGGLDAAVQVAELRHRRPANYMEVGSGFSTQFARRAIEDFALPTSITSIDPAPRTEINGLCDEIVRMPLEDADLAIFDRLGPGDVLFLDGSHTALMNSDTAVLFCEVLPHLPSGILVGIDDVFLPWDYPPGWEGRFYGEQYLLATQLLGGAAGWTVSFPGWFVTQEEGGAERFAALRPTIESSYSASFWFET